MKLILTLELHTEMRSGGTRGTICMFKRTVEVQFTASSIVILLNSGHVPIDNVWYFKPKRVGMIDEQTLTGFASTYIAQTQDALEYYQTLSQKGWVPEISNANAIRSDRYPNFYPERFSQQ